MTGTQFWDEKGLFHFGHLSKQLLDFRPEWQARNLITRVKRLIRVDPSSACHRMFNASNHEK